MSLASRHQIVRFHSKLAREAQTKDRTQKIVLPAAPFFAAALDHSDGSISVPVSALRPDSSSHPLRVTLPVVSPSRKTAHSTASDYTAKSTPNGPLLSGTLLEPPLECLKVVSPVLSILYSSFLIDF